jgi:hypothetical protein
MKISVCYVFHDEIDLIEKTIRSVFEKTKHDLTLNLHLTSGVFNQKILSIAEKIHSRYGGVLISKFENSPSKSVNLTIHDAYTNQNSDMVFVGSPDYYFTQPNEFDLFIDKASEFVDSKFFISSTREAGDGAVFQSGIYTKFGIEKIGYIDQNFVPNESSDSDYHRRCCLYYGIRSDSIFDSPYRKDIICNTEHHNHHFYKQNSSPPIRNFNKYLQNVFIFNRLNQSYFAQKWGANNECEFPFNKKKYGLKINWDQADNPYPEEYHNPLIPFF